MPKILTSSLSDHANSFSFIIQDSTNMMINRASVFVYVWSHQKICQIIFLRRNYIQDSSNILLSGPEVFFFLCFLRTWGLSRFISSSWWINNKFSIIGVERNLSSSDILPLRGCLSHNLKTLGVLHTSILSIYDCLEGCCHCHGAIIHTNISTALTVAWGVVACVCLWWTSVSVSKCCSPESAGMDQLPWEFSSIELPWGIRALVTGLIMWAIRESFELMLVADLSLG